MAEQEKYAIEAVFHPTDFSDVSAMAFHHALKIALCNASRFDILHVDDPRTPGADWSEFPQVRQTLENWNILPEGSPKEAVATQLGMKVRKVEISGRDPSTAISAFLDGQASGLLVLGTEARQGLPRWVKPSVSEDLARRSMSHSLQRGTMIATLFFPADARAFVSEATGDIELGHILVPVDQRPDPQGAIDAAGAFVSSLGTGSMKLTALHVGEEASSPEVNAPPGWNGGFDRIVRSGDAVDAIEAAAQETGAGLIAMATEGHQGFLDALRGSTTEQVVRRAPCPVLAVPSVGG